MNGFTAFLAAIILVGVWAWFALGFYFVHKPTPDELYGCTVAQQAPNGECP